MVEAFDPRHQIVSLNLGHRLALRADSEVGRIVEVMDRDGDETDNPAEIVAFTVRWPDGIRVTIDVKVGTIH